MNPQRTALLIRCSREEADRIRSAAKRERRTVSGYVLNAVMSRLVSREKLLLHARVRNPPTP
jgi:uncharacterized protein (DUF1778 family)